VAMVRVRKETQEALRALAQDAGEPMQEVLAKAVEAYRRQYILEKTNEAYAALRANPAAWREMEEERKEWETTLPDGLDDA
jgi:hypothetical protein